MGGREGGLLLTVNPKCLLVNMEKVSKFKNQHFGTII